jgi:serine/threonine-protein kinase
MTNKNQKQKTLIEHPEQANSSEKTLPMESLSLDNEGFVDQKNYNQTFGYGETRKTDELTSLVIKDKYKILKLLGEGGASKVYLSERILINDQVALKMLLFDLANDPVKVKRFRLEASNTASIKHPNVIAIYDFDFTEQGIPFIVTELLRGHTLLHEMRQKGQMSLSRSVEVLLPICSALSVAHSRGIVHRDLKPSNVVLHRMDDDSEVVKLIDFGIAKSSLNSNQVNTGPGIVFGTPSYMSPEHCLGERPVDGRADVYSLGVLLFEMLTGQLPFQAASPTALMFKHIRETPPSPRSIYPDLNPQVEEIILKSLSKEPKRRFSSTLELASELSKSLS